MASGKIDGMVMAVESASIYGEIVSETLDALNSPTYSGPAKASTPSAGSNSDLSASYDLNRSVLSAAYSDKGALADYSS